MLSALQLLAVALLLTSVLLWLKSRPPLNVSQLPGPRGYLISGNTHQVPRTEPWRPYTTWSQEFGHCVFARAQQYLIFGPQLGPVFQFRTFRRNFVVLNTIEAVTELLEKRSANYSDRPMSWMLFGLVGRGLSVFNISSLHPWHKKYRKMLHGGLNAAFIKEHWPLLQEEASKLAQTFVRDSSNLEANIRLYAIILLSNFFAHSLDKQCSGSRNDDYLRLHGVWPQG